MMEGKRIAVDWKALQKAIDCYEAAKAAYFDLSKAHIQTQGEAAAVVDAMVEEQRAKAAEARGDGCTALPPLDPMTGIHAAVVIDRAEQSARKADAAFYAYKKALGELSQAVFAIEAATNAPGYGDSVRQLRKVYLDAGGRELDARLHEGYQKLVHQTVDAAASEHLKGLGYDIQPGTNLYNAVMLITANEEQGVAE